MPSKSIPSNPFRMLSDIVNERIVLVVEVFCNLIMAIASLAIIFLNDSSHISPTQSSSFLPLALDVVKLPANVSGPHLPTVVISFLKLFVCVVCMFVFDTDSLNILKKYNNYNLCQL